MTDHNKQGNGGRFVKGQPSPNPLGRGAVSKRTRAPGSDGQVTHGGFLFSSGEKNSALIGSSKWVTQDNLVANVTIVASALRVWLRLASAAKWTPQENPRGGKDARICAELVHEGLLANRMLSKPFRKVVKRQAMSTFRGFAMHAIGWARRGDGRIIVGDLAHRPQWSIERWDKPDETLPWKGIVQRTRLGKEYPIARADLLYSVDDDLGDAPDGVGLFRHLVETERVYTRYKQLHGIGVDTDVNGIPLGRAPLSKLIQEATTAGGVTSTDTAGITAYVDARTASLRGMLENRVVTSNRSLLLDSATLITEDTDGSTKPSNVYEWSYDTVKSIIGTIPELRAALSDLNREMARVMCAEWLLMGDSEGARSVHEDKTAMFGTVINGALDDVGEDIERDVIRPMVARNGYDPDTCAPSLVHEPVHTQSALVAAEMLAELAKAGLDPDDEAPAILRARMDLPPPPERDRTEEMAPRGKLTDPDDDLDEDDERDAGKEPR